MTTIPDRIHIQGVLFETDAPGAIVTHDTRPDINIDASSTRNVDEYGSRSEQELDELADKLGSYALAKIRLGIQEPTISAGSISESAAKPGRRQYRSRRGGRAYPEISGRDVSRAIDNATDKEEQRLGRPLTDEELITVARQVERKLIG